MCGTTIRWKCYPLFLIYGHFSWSVLLCAVQNSCTAQTHAFDILIHIIAHNINRKTHNISAFQLEQKQNKKGLSDSQCVIYKVEKYNKQRRQPNTKNMHFRCEKEAETTWADKRGWGDKRREQRQRKWSEIKREIERERGKERKKQSERLQC